MATLAASAVAGQDPPAEQNLPATRRLHPKRTIPAARCCGMAARPRTHRFGSRQVRSEHSAADPRLAEGRGTDASQRSGRAPAGRGAGGGAARAAGGDGRPADRQSARYGLRFHRHPANFACDQVTKRYESHKIETTGSSRIGGSRVAVFERQRGLPERPAQWEADEERLARGQRAMVHRRIRLAARRAVHPQTDAKFKYRTTSTAAGVEAKVYDYSVSKAESHWEIRMGFSVKPPTAARLDRSCKRQGVARRDGTKSLPAGYRWTRWRRLSITTGSRSAAPST